MTRHGACEGMHASTMLTGEQEAALKFSLPSVCFPPRQVSEKISSAVLNEAVSTVSSLQYPTGLSEFGYLNHPAQLLARWRRESTCYNPSFTEIRLSRAWVHRRCDLRTYPSGVASFTFSIPCRRCLGPWTRRRATSFLRFGYFAYRTVQAVLGCQAAALICGCCAPACRVGLQWFARTQLEQPLPDVRACLCSG